MDTPKSPDEMNSSKSSMSVGIVAVGLILVVGIGAVVYKTSMNSSTPSNEKKPVMQETVTASSSPTIMASYKDGTYDATGSYVSPAGPEEIDVKLTIKDNVVTDATVTAKATAPKSKFMQDAFVGGFKEFVIGKNISEIHLSKVSGSSLTPQGFNDALEKIKTQATI